jgi:hypothetical protein
MRSAAAAVLFVVALAAPAAADPRSDLVDGMTKCAAIGDGPARLACYDALNPALKAAQAEPPASVAAAVPPAPVAANPPAFDPYRKLGVPTEEQVKPDQFGGEHLAPPPPPPPPPGQVAQAPAPAAPEAVDSITAGVTDYSFNPYDKFLVILDNGQIWQQLESDEGIKARFSKGGKNTVAISRGLIGSYNMQINDGSAIYKVKRLK